MTTVLDDAHLMDLANLRKLRLLFEEFPTKLREGRFCFLWPFCATMLATVNCRNNLAHCFGRSKNLNNIDLLRLLGYDFPTAVAILERLLHRHQSRLPTPTPEKA